MKKRRLPQRCTAALKAFSPERLLFLFLWQEETVRLFLREVVGSESGLVLTSPTRSGMPQEKIEQADPSLSSRKTNLNFFNVAAGAAMQSQIVRLGQALEGPLVRRLATETVADPPSQNRIDAGEALRQVQNRLLHCTLHLTVLS